MSNIEYQTKSNIQIRHMRLTFDLKVGFSLIFDIRHSKFECEIEFDIRYSTFNLNDGFSLIFDIRHSNFECEIEFDI